MDIQKNKYIDTQNDHRVSFQLKNFEYGFQIGKKISGLWSSRLRISFGQTEYEIVWHEDFGNEIYSLDQSDGSVARLEKQLDHILSLLNSKKDRC